MNTEAFLKAQLARPFTHRITTTFADGSVRTFDARSLGAANNHAVLERRKIGLDLLSRETGEKIRVVAVTVTSL